MAEDGELGHYSEGNVLHVLLKPFANAMQTLQVRVMSTMLYEDLRGYAKRENSKGANISLLNPPRHTYDTQYIFMPQMPLSL